MSVLRKECRKIDAAIGADMCVAFRKTRLISMSYAPQPIDTTAVHLSPALIALTERLAENAHDIWAAHRFADGWTHGSKRDDAAKKHPCLVPYAELPESEKEYDRTVAMGTLGAIVALGFSVES